MLWGSLILLFSHLICHWHTMMTLNSFVICTVGVDLYIITLAINTLRGYRNQRNQKKTPAPPTRYLWDDLNREYFLIDVFPFIIFILILDSVGYCFLCLTSLISKHRIFWFRYLWSLPCNPYFILACVYQWGHSLIHK